MDTTQVCSPSTFAHYVGTLPALVARLDSKGAIRRWAAAEPALTGARSVSRLRDWTASDCDRQRAHAVLAALVRIASVDQDDGRTPDPDAALVVIHLLRPAITRKARAMGEKWTETLPVLIAELALVIQTFPWRTATPLPSHLVLDAWNQAWSDQVWRDSRGTRQNVTTTSNLHSREETPDEQDAGLELVDVLTEAAHEDVLNSEQAALVWRMIRAGGYATHGATAAVAAELGVDGSTVRRRYRRAVAALTAHHQSAAN